MSRKEDILGALAGQTGPMNRATMAKKIGKPTSDWQRQLNGFEKQGLVIKNEELDYSLTEAGYEFLRAAPPESAAVSEAALPGGAAPPGGIEPPGGAAPPGGIEPPGGAAPPGDVVPPVEPTDESLKTTEYQQFLTFGKTTGVWPMTIIEQTAKHVWSGGNFRDLTWVWHGLTQMGIRPDLAQRWWHSWRSFLHQAIPPDLADAIGLQAPGVKGAEVGGKGKKDYIIGPNDLPLHVGDGVGDLDYEDAVKLSAITKAGLARIGIQAGPPGQPATPGSMADELIKIVTAFKETMGPQVKAKSFVVKPTEEGYIVEEVEEGKPTIIATPSLGPKAGTPTSGWMVNSETGEVTELAAGRPVVIKAATPSAAPPKAFIIRQTPEGYISEELDPSKPIIINNPQPSPGMNMPPMWPYPAMDAEGKPVYDQNGQPVYVNVEPMLKVWGFQSEQKRQDERHQMLMGLGQAIRENIGDGVAAIKKAASEIKGAPGKKTPAPQQGVFECAVCHTQFSPPEGWEGQPLKCPTCGKEYTKEDLEK